MIPPFDDLGRLPLGEHVATWEEVVERFGWNSHRRRLLDGLADGLEALSSAGCRQVWLNGSFVTAKDEPADFDTCWDLDGVDLDRVDPVLLDLSAGRRAQKARFGGEFFPNVVEADSGLVFADFFQNDRETGRKGIIVVHLEELP
ncbi:MAG: DUF6932 family protein [Acidimicrobiales bacterium]